MSRNKGTFNFAANFEGLLKAPIDARQLVGTYADLILPATWSGSTGVWLYDGAIVSVGSDLTPSNNGIYWLCDSANYTCTNSWVKANSGGGTITGATNGLTTCGNNIILGGTLTGTTKINGSQTFNINVSTLNLTGSTAINLTSPAVTLQTTPSIGTISDSVVVWNSVDKKLKTIAGSCLGNKNNIYSRSAVTTSVILNTGSSYVILVSGTSITVTLPSTPISGQVFRIKDACGNALTYNVTIDSGAGKTIDGSQCAVINTDYGALELMYGATNKWFNLAFVN